MPDAHPDRAALIDEDGEFTYKELDEAVHAVANGLHCQGRPRRRRRCHPGAQPPLVSHRQLRRRPGRRPHHLAQQRVLRPADQRGVGARGRQGDHLRRRVHQGCQQGRARAGQAARARGTNPDTDEPSGSTDETLAELIERSSKDTRPEGEQARVDHHPDQRHDRHPEGGKSQYPADAGAGRRHLVARSVQGRRGDLAAGADVPCAGLPARHTGDVPGLDAGAAAQVQAAAGARRHREAQGDRHGRRAGDAVADPRRGREDGQEARSVQPEDRVRIRLAVGRRAGQPRAQRPRSGDLQHVRLDRDRVRHHRRAQAPGSAMRRRSVRSSRV